MFSVRFSIHSAERHLLALSGDMTGPEASAKSASPENAERLDAPEATKPLQDDVDATLHIENTIAEESPKLLKIHTRITLSENHNLSAQPSEKSGETKASSQENFDHASVTLQHLKNMSFLEQSSHRAAQESISRSTQEQGKKIANRKGDELLKDMHSNEWRNFDRKEAGKESSRDIVNSHESLLEHKEYSNRMEEDRALLREIHVHPTLNAISLSQAVCDNFGLQAHVITLEEWNKTNGTAFTYKQNTGLLDANDPAADSNRMQELVAKDPSALMNIMKQRMESLKKGGNVLHDKEQMMIEDALYDDIPQSVENVLDSAQLQENGEWKIEHGKEALTFLKNYAKPVAGDDFLDAEEKSWRVQSIEYHRKEEDGARIETQKRIETFKGIVQEMGAGDKWDAIEPLLLKASAPLPPDGGSDSNNGYEARDEIYQILFAASDNPEIVRANAVQSALLRFQEHEAIFLQAGGNYQEKLGPYEAEVKKLAAEFPELGINPSMLVFQPNGALLDTAYLLKQAEEKLHDVRRSASNPSHRKAEEAMTHIMRSRVGVQYNNKQVETEKTRPTRREALGSSAQEKTVNPDGSLTLNNDEMDHLRSVVQRRATQTVRVYRNRVHDVTPDGVTVEDPVRMRTVDPQRIFVAQRTPAIIARIDAWSESHLHREETAEPLTPSERRESLETLQTVRDSVKKHLDDVYGGKFPPDVAEQFASAEELMAENWTLTTGADALTPEDEVIFQDRLLQTRDLLSNILRDQKDVLSSAHDPEKLQKTFDAISEDKFVTLSELEASVLSLRSAPSATGQEADSQELQALESLITAARTVQQTKIPQQVNGTNITINRHGEAGIHRDNARKLLDAVHADHVVVETFASVDVLALATARCPVTVLDTTITPQVAQMLRDYSGDNAVLTLPNIHTISREAIAYMAKMHCNLGLRITHSEVMTEDIIQSLHQFRDPGHEVEIVLPEGMEISDELMTQYEEVAENNAVRGHTIKLLDRGAIRLPSVEEKVEAEAEEMKV